MDYDFAMYVLDNMHRASLSNALTITNKFDIEYNIEDFIKSLQKYALEYYKQNKINSHILSNILFSCDKCQKTLDKINKKEYNGNIQMIRDDFIIGLWEAFQ